MREKKKVAFSHELSVKKTDTGQNNEFNKPSNGRNSLKGKDFSLNNCQNGIQSELANEIGRQIVMTNGIAEMPLNSPLPKSNASLPTKKRRSGLLRMIFKARKVMKSTCVAKWHRTFCSSDHPIF